MLSTLQTRIAELYDLDLHVAIDDFLCDEALATRLGGVEALERGEVLFVVEGEHPEVALFVDPAAHTLEGDGWLADAPDRFRAASIATEGVSHFVYVAFRSDHALSVSELELELQAEIDKWVIGLFANEPSALGPSMLEGQGAKLIALRDRSRRLRQRLFRNIAYHDPIGTERGDRYRTAVRLASRYVEELDESWVARGRYQDLVRELRRFYRLGSYAKYERIA